MKKIIPFIVFCTVNLLALTNIYGQTIKLQTPQLKDNIKNYFPKIGPVQINNDNTTGETEAPRFSLPKSLSCQLQKGTLLSRNQYSNIYKLPIDQMPCVVPNNSVCYKMNFSKKGSNELAENMPNLMKKQNWLPSKN